MTPQTLALFAGYVIEAEFAAWMTRLSRRLLQNLKIVQKDKIGIALAWIYLVINLTATHHLVRAGINANFNFYFIAGGLLVNLGAIANRFVILQNRGRMPVDYNGSIMHYKREWILISTRGRKLKLKAMPEKAAVSTEKLNQIFKGLDYYECFGDEKDKKHTLMLPSVRYHWLCDITQNKNGVSSFGDQMMTIGLVIMIIGLIFITTQSTHSL